MAPDTERETAAQTPVAAAEPADTRAAAELCQRLDFFPSSVENDELAAVVLDTTGFLRRLTRSHP